MTKGISGRKVGMTQIFTKSGILVPVAIIETTPDTVLQVKTNKSDGYEAVQVDYQDVHEVLSNKPTKGHAAEAKASPKRFIREIRDVELKDYEVGSEITVDSLNEGDVVDITETTRGHGTRGSIERWGRSRSPGTHDSRYHRIPDSMDSVINRVPKDKKLSGHMGGKEVTIQNLVVEKVVSEKNVLSTKDSVPSTENSLISIKPAAKAVK